MAGFTSGRRAQVGLPLANHDPHPWLEPDGSRYLTVEAYYTGRPREFAPRPEFDVPDNPILKEFRRSAPWDVQRAARIAADWLEPPASPIPRTSSPKQIEHARRVLRKLEAL